MAKSMPSTTSILIFAVSAVLALCGCATRGEPPMSLQERWNRIVEYQDAAARGFVENH
jgi:hypothetical protein